MKPKLVCAECSAEVQPGDMFCPSCGVPVEWESEKPGAPVSADKVDATPDRPDNEIICDVCGHQNPVTSGFCESCGAKLKGAYVPAKKGSRGESSGKPGPELREGRKRTTAPVSSGKLLLIAAAVLLVGFGFYFFLIDRDADRPPVHDDPGGAAMRQSIMQEIERLEHELEFHDPDNQAALLRLANLYHDMRQYENALVYYELYIGENPDNPDVRVDLGICYFEDGQPEKAVATVEEVVSDFPEHQLAVFNLGILYLNLADLESANRYLERAYEIDPDNQTGRRARHIMEEHAF